VLTLSIIISLCILSFIPSIDASSAETDTPTFSETSHTMLRAKQLLSRNHQNYTLSKISTITIGSTDYYEAMTSQTIPSALGNIDIEVTTLINTATEEITIKSKNLQINNKYYKESTNQLILIHNDELIILDNIQDKELYYKALNNHIEPLIDPYFFINQKLNHTQSFAIITSSNAELENQILTIDGYAVHIVQRSDLEPLFRNRRILRIANNEPRNLKKLVNFARQLFREEAEKLAKDLKLHISHQDVISFSDLKDYLNDEPWSPDPGQTSPYQKYVTPDASAVTAIVSRYTNPQDIYEYAREWIWVSDMHLHNSNEKWLLPTQFLSETPGYSTNPSPGSSVSDCSEQANTLCSALRASGVYPEDVRVAIGEVNFDGSIGGHAWVEIKEDGKWLVLDPTSGPYYDEEQKRLFNRNGVEYNYWKYHPYPIEELWVYYNDVYFTDENAEVADGWSTPYDIFLDEEMLAGFFRYSSENLYYLYVFLAISSSVFLLVFLGLRTSRSKKE
jgi:hypothetical protein